jgi:hypothetical protein
MSLVESLKELIIAFVPLGMRSLEMEWLIEISNVITGLLKYWLH